MADGPDAIRDDPPGETGRTIQICATGTFRGDSAGVQQYMDDGSPPWSPPRT
jgi:hypothetical protein